MRHLLLTLVLSLVVWGCNPDSSANGIGTDSTNDTESENDSETGDDTGNDTATNGSDDSDTGSDAPECNTYDPLTPSAEACYDECYAEAIINPDGCQAEYDACQNNADCSAYDAFLTENCNDEKWHDGTEPDYASYAACIQASPAYAVGEPLKSALDTCINCDACKCSCDGLPGVYCEDSCDSSVHADDTKYGYDFCWGCATIGECAAEQAAYEANPVAAQLDECFNGKGGQPNCNDCEKDENCTDYASCIANCRLTYADGAAELDALHTCIYCDVCTFSLAPHAAGKGC